MQWSKERGQTTITKHTHKTKHMCICFWRKNIFDIYVTEYGTALTTILPILFLYLNTVTVTAATFVYIIMSFDFPFVRLFGVR